MEASGQADRQIVLPFSSLYKLHQEVPAPSPALAHTLPPSSIEVQPLGVPLGGKCFNFLQETPRGMDLHT